MGAPEPFKFEFDHQPCDSGCAAVDTLQSLADEYVRCCVMGVPPQYYTPGMQSPADAAAHLGKELDGVKRDELEAAITTLRICGEQQERVMREAEGFADRLLYESMQWSNTMFRNPGTPSSLEKSPKKKGKLPAAAIEDMKCWLAAHCDNPYPSEQVKLQFARDHQLELNQVSNWFINARRRLIPMMAHQSGRQNIEE